MHWADEIVPKREKKSGFSMGSNHYWAGRFMICVEKGQAANRRLTR